MSLREVNSFDEKPWKMLMWVSKAEEGPTRRWSSCGLVALTVFPDEPERAYQTLLEILHDHFLTRDPCRPFFLWPGFEFKVPIVNAHALHARLCFLRKQYQIVHVSIASGLETLGPREAFELPPGIGNATNDTTKRTSYVNPNEDGTAHTDAMQAAGIALPFADNSVTGDLVPRTPTSLLQSRLTTSWHNIIEEAENRTQKAIREFPYRAGYDDASHSRFQPTGLDIQSLDNLQGDRYANDYLLEAMVALEVLPEKIMYLQWGAVQSVFKDGPPPTRILPRSWRAMDMKERDKSTKAVTAYFVLHHENSNHWMLCELDISNGEPRMRLFDSWQSTVLMREQRLHFAEIQMRKIGKALAMLQHSRFKNTSWSEVKCVHADCLVQAGKNGCGAGGDCGFIAVFTLFRLAACENSTVDKISSKSDSYMVGKWIRGMFSERFIQYWRAEKSKEPLGQSLLWAFCDHNIPDPPSKKTPMIPTPGKEI